MKKTLMRLLPIVMVFSMILCGNINVGKIYADTVDDYTFTVSDVVSGDASISGTGVPTAEVEVTYQDGNTSTATVGADGKWSTGVPSSVVINEGDDIRAEQKPKAAVFEAEPFLVYQSDKNTEIYSVEQNKLVCIKFRILNTGLYSKATNISGTYTYDGSNSVQIDSAALNGPTATDEAGKYILGTIVTAYYTGSEISAADYISSLMGGKYANPKFNLTSYDDAGIETVETKALGKYKVTYDANGGSGSVVDSREYLVNEKAEILEGNTLKRKEYKFKEWNTEKNGSGISFKAGDKVPMEQDMTLYAQWTYDPSPTPGVIVEPPITDDPPPDKTTKTDSTKTGDENNSAVWFVIMGMSLLGAGYLIKRKNA